MTDLSKRIEEYLKSAITSKPTLDNLIIDHDKVKVLFGESSIFQKLNKYMLVMFSCHFHFLVVFFYVFVKSHCYNSGFCVYNSDQV